MAHHTDNPNLARASSRTGVVVHARTLTTSRRAALASASEATGRAQPHPRLIGRVGAQAGGHSAGLSAVIRAAKEEQAFRAVRAAQGNRVQAVAVATQPYDFTAHEQARAKAEAIYKRAMAKVVAQAEASALASRKQDEDERKKRRTHDEEAAALLFLLAGVAAYKATYRSLALAPQGALGAPGAAFAPTGLPGAAIGLPAPGPVGPESIPEPESDAEVEEQAETYAQERVKLLKDVPAKVREALDTELAKPEAAAESLRELSERLGKVAQRIEDGYGKTVVETETHTAYGHAALRVLVWRGYDTKLWQAVGDEKTCPTCAACEDRGAMPLSAEFIPGVQAPPAHPNCRCWLVGGSKAESVSASDPIKAVHVKTYTRTDPRTGKQETVAEHEDKRAKQMTPEQAGHVRVDKGEHAIVPSELAEKPQVDKASRGFATIENAQKVTLPAVLGLFADHSKDNPERVLYRGEDAAPFISKVTKTPFGDASRISKSTYPIVQVHLENGSSFFYKVRFSDHGQVSSNAPQGYDVDMRMTEPTSKKGWDGIQQQLAYALQTTANEAWKDQRMQLTDWEPPKPPKPKEPTKGEKQEHLSHLKKMLLQQPNNRQFKQKIDELEAELLSA